MRYTMDHALDIRRHVRLPWARYYLVLLCGRDFRPREPGRRNCTDRLAVTTPHCDEDGACDGLIVRLTP
jgi:hypothetical protein